jgi:hypothetical protein
MSAHIANELPRLLTGEASRDEVMTAAAHLRTCVDCQQELVSAVVAHASLTSAQRFAPEIVSGLSVDLFAERGGSDLNDPRLEDETIELADDQSAIELPDLSAVFAQVRKEAAEPPRRAPAPRSRTRYLVAAAAAVVVLGGGATIYFATAHRDSSSHLAGRTFTLAAYDTGQSPATASIASGGKLKIDAASLPQMSGKRYEVWLTNDGRTKMQPVGWIGADGKAAMTVPEDLLSKYSDLEVSVQDVDASDYAYSGTSVLRGYYE